MTKLNFLKPLPVKDKIRLGCNADGGYVVYKKAILAANVLLSYGVGWEISFEEHFNRISNKKVLMFDHTMFGKYLFNFKYYREVLFRMNFREAYLYPRQIWRLWKLRQQLATKGIIFINEGISCHKTGKCDTFASHIKRFKLDGQRLFIKMDIEEGEYDIFMDPSFYMYLQPVTQMVIEFHNLENRLNAFFDILEKLSTDFELVHIHANNYGGVFQLTGLPGNTQEDIMIPDTLELSFAKKECIDPDDILEHTESYPVAHLDFPNDPSKQDYALSFI